MTNPTPLSKATELIGSINEMLADGVNAERMEEIIAAANKLKDHGHYTDAYKVLGMIASLRGNSAEVDRLFTAAIHSGSRNAVTLFNYAAALGNLGRIADAIKIMDELVDMGTTDLNLIRVALKYHLDAFDIDGARKLIAKHEALGRHIDDPNLSSELEIIESAMEGANVTWPEIAVRIELAASVLLRLGLFPRCTRRFIRDGIIMNEFIIGADVGIVSEAEIAINDAISEESYTSVDDLLYLTCSAI